MVRAVRPFYVADRIEPHPRKAGTRGGPKRRAGADKGEAETATGAAAAQHEDGPEHAVAGKVTQTQMRGAQAATPKREHPGKTAEHARRKRVRIQEASANEEEHLDEDDDSGAAEAMHGGDDDDAQEAGGTDGGEGEDGEDGEDGEGEDEGEDSEVFTAAKTKDEAEEKPKRVGSVLRSAKEIYAAPTHDELASLKETENLFKSNLFRMQVDEFLKEVRPPAKSAFIERALKDLKTLVESIPATASAEASPETFAVDGVHAPLLLGRRMNATAFHFARPASVRVVGSYLLDTFTKYDQNIDVAVEMPSECLHPRDHLNNVYFAKRAFYLTVIAAALRKKPMFAGATFTTFQGSRLKPIIVVAPVDPATNKATNIVIRIHITISSSAFVLKRLAPDRNSVRRAKTQWLHDECGVTTEGDETATPRYNNAILADMFFSHHLKLLFKYTSDPLCSGLADAILLLKMWLRQRGLAHTTCSGFFVSMLLVDLMQKRKLPKESSSYQLFRAAMTALAETDWTVAGARMEHIHFDPAFPSAGDSPSLETFHAAFDVVFLDPSGFLNLLGGMTRANYSALRQEAQRALSLLDDSTHDGFSSIFIERANLTAKYDVVVRATVPPTIARRYPAQLLDRLGDWLSFGSALIIAVLVRGLGTRVAAIHAILPPPQQWPVTQSPPRMQDDPAVQVGIALNADEFDRTLDRGPLSDQDGVEAFRNFWGPKCETRRFEDGAILEALVWQPREDTTGVFRSVVRYLLQRHCALDPQDVRIISHPLESLLALGESKGDKGLVETRVILKEFEDLSMALKSLDGLQLPIVSLKGASAVFRYAEVFPPGEHDPFRPALDCVVQLEPSGKWPEDLGAIAHVKTALLIRIARLLKEQGDIASQATAEYLDVFIGAHVFRLHLHVDFEFKLLEQQHLRLSSAVAALQQAGTPRADVSLAALKAQAALAKAETALIHRPVHTAALHSLQGRFPGFCATVRLAKRWVHAQMMSGHVSEEAVELLVAHLFLHPGAYRPPVAPHIGLLRFLQLLATYDWIGEPLIVDLPDPLTEAHRSWLSKTFIEERDALPVLCIATMMDPKSALWTSASPSKPVFARLVSLARAAVKVLSGILDDLRSRPEGSDADLMQLFRPATSVFDAVLTLNPAVLARELHAVDGPKESKKSKYKNIALAAAAKKQPVGFDPAHLYLAELRQRYAHAAQFFFDACGGRQVGVVWNPAATQPHPFKVANSQDTMPIAPAKGKKAAKTETEDMVVLNRRGVLAGAALLGEGLVSSVAVNRE